MGAADGCKLLKGMRYMRFEKRGRRAAGGSSVRAKDAAAVFIGPRPKSRFQICSGELSGNSSRAGARSGRQKERLGGTAEAVPFHESLTNLFANPLAGGKRGGGPISRRGLRDTACEQPHSTDACTIDARSRPLISSFQDSFVSKILLVTLFSSRISWILLCWQRCVSA